MGKLKHLIFFPIIITTSDVTKELKALVGDMGAMEILEKPLALNSIRECLEKIKKKIIE